MKTPMTAMKTAMRTGVKTGTRTGTRKGLRKSTHLAVAGMATIGVTFGFARYGYGLFLPELRRDFGLSVSLVGVIGSATYAGYVVALLLVGGLVSRFGPRPLVVMGGVSATAGMGLVALAREPVTLTVGLILAGTSAGWAWAPYSDAVDRMVERSRRERVMGAIASGTAFAVALAGPLALLARDTGWRPVWLLFAALSALTTGYNLAVLPGGAHRPAAARDGRRLSAGWFVRGGAATLFATAVLYGLVGAVYWAFAVETVAGAAGAGSALVPLFWGLMGLAGTAGVLTGHAIARYGLRRVHTGLFAGIALAVALLGLAPGSLPAVAASAVLYGPCFMAGSGLLAVWSYQVYPERPSTGFSATVFFLGLGTIGGPATLGLFADSYGLRAAFLVTAALAVGSLAVRPARSARAAARVWPVSERSKGRLLNRR